MQLLFAGIGLEILSLLAVILYDLFRIPFIISLLLHTGAAYLFTRGIEPWLKKVRLRREVSFLFSLILPFYGMIGLLFQVFVLRRIAVLKALIRENNISTETAEAVAPEFFLFENDPIAELTDINIKKIHYDSLPDEVRVLDCNYFSNDRFEKLAREARERMHELEKKLNQDPGDSEIPNRLAGLYLDYASNIETEKIAKQKYLVSAKNILKELVKKDPADFKLLAGLMEVHFLLGESSECVKLCKKILAKDQVHELAVMRLAESYYRKRDYKKLIELSQNVRLQVKKPRDLEYFTKMWAANG